MSQSLLPRILVALLWAVCAVTISAAAAADDVRMWSDASGKYKIQAKFVELQDGKVTLLRPDGKELIIELKKLSAADQKHVAELVAPAADPDDPFKEKASPAKTPSTPAAPNTPAAPAEFNGLMEPKTLTINYDGAALPSPAPEESDWNLDIPPNAEPALTPRSITIPPKTDFFEGLHGFATNSVAKRAVLGYHLKKGNEGGVARLVLVDLAAGRVVGGGKDAADMAPLALHDNGQWVLMRRSEFGFGNSDRLQMWGVTAKGVVRGVTWTPYDTDKGGDRDVGWASFIAEDRLLTLSNKGKLVLWNLNPLEPIYVHTLAGGMVPGLSGDRKRLIYSVGQDIGVLETATGKVLATQKAPTQHLAFPVFAFSPGGRRFACAAFDRVFVWDAATGLLQKELLLPNVHIGGQMIWTDDEHILVANQWLLDVPREIKLWQYTGHDRAANAGGITWLAASGGSPAGVVGAKLPGKEVLEALKKAEAEPDFFILKPGMGVKIDVNGLLDAGERDKVVRSLTEKLTERGFTVNPNSAVTLTATTEAGPEQEVAYHSFGSFGARVYKLKTFPSKLKFMYEGKPAWESQGTNIPGFINPKKDELVTDYLKQFEKPNYDWFGRVELPKSLVKPTGKPALGVTNVTTAGVR